MGRVAILVLMLSAEAGWADVCASVKALDDYPASQVAPDDAKCATYLTTAGTTGTSCHWEFAFRDAAALGFAEGWWGTLMACRPGETMGADQLVNHPDSYDLRELASSNGVYAISVKDKGTLNRTLVFLRVEPK